MKLTSVKSSVKSFVSSTVTRSLALGLLAGTFAFAAPHSADAQGFGVAVQFGHPGYVGPVYGPVYGPGNYDRVRAEEWRAREDWRRHEDFVRHEAWVRDREFRERHEGFGPRGYRGSYFGR